MDVDLRTVIPGKRTAAKYQPEWARSIYEVMTRKRSNIQLGLEVHLAYDCSVVRSPSAVDLFAASWIAMLPVLSFVLGE